MVNLSQSLCTMPCTVPGHTLVTPVNDHWDLLIPSGDQRKGPDLCYFPFEHFLECFERVCLNGLRYCNFLRISIALPVDPLLYQTI